MNNPKKYLTNLNIQLKIDSIISGNNNGNQIFPQTISDKLTNHILGHL